MMPLIRKRLQMHIVLFHSHGLLSHRWCGTSIPTPDTHEKKLNGDKCACYDVREVQSIEDGSESGDTMSWTSESILPAIFFVLASAVRPLEYQREDDGFNAGHERGDTKINVIVGGSCRRVEELAIQKVENYLTGYR